MAVDFALPFFTIFTKTGNRILQTGFPVITTDEPGDDNKPLFRIFNRLNSMTMNFIDRLLLFKV
ncbi:MAG: hypothetical protein E3K36_04645 [Candidatus Brocadia sp.]|nr:hypothetical protein [Candidatus Brocadia sp.]